MRIFIHLKGFTFPPSSRFQRLKIIKNNEKSLTTLTIVRSMASISTTDQLIGFIAQGLGAKEEDVIIKLVVKHQTQYKRITMVKGLPFSIYSRVPSDRPSTMSYQLELQVTLIGPASDGAAKESLKAETSLKQENPQDHQKFNSHQIYLSSRQLFQILKKDELSQFVNLLDLFSVKYSPSQLRILLNLFDGETGFSLLHHAIMYNRNNLLQALIKDYSDKIDYNLKSIDGWLPVQLAIVIQNRKCMDLFIKYYEIINLDFNCHSENGQVIFNLIDTINLELISKIVKRFPIRFEDQHSENGINVYDYVWNHHRLVEIEKKQILSLMHEKHIEHYDYYRWDQLLYTTCKKYLPEATEQISPRKQAGGVNPSLKIISGQIIKCKNSAFSSSKYVFLSVNSYIGAIQEYEVNSKLKLKNDQEKLDKYSKQVHISFEEVKDVYMLQQKEKSWLMKKEWYCFVVREKRDTKYVFACNHQYTAHQWIEQIKQAIKAWEKSTQPFENHTERKLTNVSKKYVHISDVQYKSSEAEMPKQKQGAKKLIEFFSNRLSLCQSETTTNETSLDKSIQATKSKSSYNTLTTQLSSQPLLETKSLRYKDFKLLQLLGQGSFGQVFLCQCLKNKKMYALKIFQKKKIILSKQTKFVIAEVNILKQINHPFIISLYFTFQTPNYIYLGLQYCQGKDLSKHLNQEMTFEESDVKIYAAEIVLAIQYLHSMGIIYRDLKPENIMLGKDGHVLLVDFGLSKKTENNFAKTFCGSPAYLSPEMLDRHGVGPESDYFTLGVVIYEFIFGQPPFFADNIHVLYQNIQNGSIKFPRRINDVTVDFLTKLLEKQPKKRLGSRSIDDIKNHEYFAGMSWQKLYRKEIPAPHRDLLDEINDQVQEHKGLINIFHDDFDYSQQNIKINRFKNFSFTREEQFL